MIAAAPKAQMSQTGLNFLRIVLASYFIGISLGVVEGTNVTLVAHLIFSHNVAEFIANTLVFIAAYFILMGMWVRPAAIGLAAIILSNTIWQAFMGAEPFATTVIWRDLILICALTMTHLQFSMRADTDTKSLRGTPRIRRPQTGEVIPSRRGAPLRREDMEPQRAILRTTPDGTEVINIFAA